MPLPRLISTLTTAGRPGAAADGKRFRKDVARIGNYVATDPQNGGRVDLKIDGDRIDKWVENFDRFRQAGNVGDLTTDHEDRTAGAADRLGPVDRLFRGRFEGDQLIEDPAGDVLGMDCGLADDDAIKTATRCPHVSLELETNVTDGVGGVYDELIPCVSITRQPIVPGQQPFRMVASRAGGDTATAVRLQFSRQSSSEPPAPTPKGPPTMDPKTQAALLAAVATLTGTTLTAESKADDITAALKQLDGRQLAGPDDADKLGQLAELTKERDTLAEKLKGMDGGKAPEVDSDLLEQTAEVKAEKLDNAVTAGKITPAAAKIAASRFLGAPGKRPAVCLSRKAAVHAGMGGPAFDDLMAVLDANDPVELNKQRTGPQTVLSRPVHGGDDDDSADAMKAATDARVAAAK